MNEQKYEKRYEILLWDADETLLDFSLSQEEALKKAFQSYKLPIDEEIVAVYSKINDAYWKRLEKGEITKEQVLLGRFESLFMLFAAGEQFADKGVDISLLKRIDVLEFAQCYQTNLGKSYFYMEDSLQLTKQFKEAGFKQYIITNGVAATQRSKLTLAGFYDVMDAVFISEEIGTHKPDPAFFEEICKKIFAPHLLCRIEDIKEKILVIGDSQTSDMELARRCGLDCCLYQRKKDGQNTSTREDEKVTYRIRHLGDLEAILWQKHKNKD